MLLLLATALAAVLAAAGGVRGDVRSASFVVANADAREATEAAANGCDGDFAPRNPGDQLGHGPPATFAACNVRQIGVEGGVGETLDALLGGPINTGGASAVCAVAEGAAAIVRAGTYSALWLPTTRLVVELVRPTTSAYVVLSSIVPRHALPSSPLDAARELLIVAQRDGDEVGRHVVRLTPGASNGHVGARAALHALSSDDSEFDTLVISALGELDSPERTDGVCVERVVTLCAPADGDDDAAVCAGAVRETNPRASAAAALITHDSFDDAAVVIKNVATTGNAPPAPTSFNMLAIPQRNNDITTMNIPLDQYSINSNPNCPAPAVPAGFGHCIFGETPLRACRHEGIGPEDLRCNNDQLYSERFVHVHPRHNGGVRCLAFQYTSLKECTCLYEYAAVNVEANGNPHDIDVVFYDTTTTTLSTHFFKNNIVRVNADDPLKPPVVFRGVARFSAAGDSVTGAVCPSGNQDFDSSQARLLLTCPPGCLVDNSEPPVLGPNALA